MSVCAEFKQAPEGPDHLCYANDYAKHGICISEAGQ